MIELYDEVASDSKAVEEMKVWLLAKTDAGLENDKGHN